MDFDQQALQEILSKHKLGRVLSIEKERIGITGNVFNINSKFILKIEGKGGQDKHRVERSVVMCKILEKNKIIAPRIIALDISKKIIKQKYVIMTRLEGDNLADVWKELPKNEQDSIVTEYVEILVRMHQIKLDKFGDIVNNHQQHSSWYNYLTGRYNKYFNYLEKYSILSAKILNQVQGLFKENDALFHIKTDPVLVHADFRAKNIKYYNGKINGIFDFDECLGGHNEFEFTKVFLPYTVDNSFKDSIISSYKANGSLSASFFQRVRLYSLGFLLNVLWFSHSNKLITPELKLKYSNGINKLLK